MSNEFFHAIVVVSVVAIAIMLLIAILDDSITF